MRAIFALFLFLGACRGQSESEKANAEIQFLEAHHASDDQRCAAYTKLVQADLDERNDKAWDIDSVIQRNVCLTAAAERRLRAEED